MTKADNLDALAHSIERQAVGRNLFVIRSSADDFEYHPYPPYLDHEVTSVLQLALDLGVQVIQILRIRFDHQLDGRSELQSRSGQCAELYVGFTFNSETFWARQIAEWMAESRADPDPRIDSQDAPETQSDQVGRSQYIDKAEMDLLVETVTKHRCLQHLSPSAANPIRSAADACLDEVVAELSVHLPDDYRSWIVQRITGQVMSERQAACDAVESDIAMWAQGLASDATFHKPTAAQRDEHCKHRLAGHLGFTPTKVLCQRIRQYADGLGTQRQ